MFNNSNDGFTMPVMPAYGGGYGSGFGSDGGWFIWLVVILAIFGGWGNGAWGGYGGGQSTSVYEGYVLNNDFSQISKQISDTYNMTDRKFEGIANGICSLGYDQQAQMNGINTNIMQGTNTLQAAIKDCCCQTQQNIADVKYTIGSTGADLNYNLATQANMLDRAIADGFCKTNYNNATNTRDIIDATKAGFLSLDNKIDAIRYDMMRDKYEAERDAKFALQGQLDRAQLRTQIVNDVRPCPIPAYITCNPFGCNCQQNVYGTTIA